jgi:PE family/PPE-SVP subfamily C-terminal region
MSFVTAQSPALMAAATRLQHLGTAMAAQNTAAATPTTGVAPAAADPVSALQAMQFSAYGTWYQQVSQQAQAIHQALVNTLGSSAGSYGETESANQAATGSTSLTGLLNSLTGGSSTAATDPTGLSSNFGATIGTPFNWAQNFSAASSDMLDLAQGQYAPEASQGASSAGILGLTGDFNGAPPPAAAPSAAGFSAMPVSAGVGQASSIGKLSVPPTWAVSEVGAVNPAPATMPSAGWTSAAPQGATVTTLPAGMPSAASSGRGGLGIGAPRYGLKPTVMPKPTLV